MINLFSYRDYKRYLLDLVEENQGVRGFKKQLATAAGCQPSLISRVIHSELHLTPEHTDGIAKFLNFTDLESEFFENLVHYCRAGSATYRDRILKRLEKISEAASDLSRVFSSPEIGSAEAQMFYYSSWVPSAVHICCAIPSLQTPRLIAEMLHLPVSEVSQTLTRLRELGLVAEEKGKFQITKSFLHLPKNSFLIASHHTNWRNRAILNCQSRDPASVHFTGVFAMGAAQYEQIKAQIQKCLSDINDTVKTTSHEEALVCVTLDAFRI